MNFGFEDMKNNTILGTPVEELQERAEKLKESINETFENKSDPFYSTKLLDSLFQIANELDCRDSSHNCLHDKYLTTSWNELCDKGIEILKKLKG